MPKLKAWNPISKETLVKYRERHTSDDVAMQYGKVGHNLYLSGL